MKLVPVTEEWLRKQELPVKVYRGDNEYDVTAIGRRHFLFDNGSLEDLVRFGYAEQHFKRPIKTETRWVNYYGDDCGAYEHGSKDDADFAANSYRIACFSYEKEVE